MKTLKQIQEENRKAIIMACNSKAKSYEEALEMELGFGCEVSKFIDSNIRVIIRKNSLPSVYYDIPKNTINNLDLEIFDQKVASHHILGKPLTLNRVLIALNEDTLCCYKENKTNFSITKINQDLENQIQWDLTKETLEEQSEDTQREINKLLV